MENASEAVALNRSCILRLDLHTTIASIHVRSARGRLTQPVTQQRPGQGKSTVYIKAVIIVIISDSNRTLTARVGTF